MGFSSVSSKGRKWGRLPPSVIFLGSALSCRSYPPPVLWPLTFLHSDCVCYCPGAGDSEQGDCPGRRCRESLPEKLLGSLTRGQHVGTWCGANAVKKKKKVVGFCVKCCFCCCFIPCCRLSNTTSVKPIRKATTRRVILPSCGTREQRAVCAKLQSCLLGD